MYESRNMARCIVAAFGVLFTFLCLGGKDMKAKPFVNLRPEVSKLKTDTGWEPRVSFTESVRSINV